MRKLLIFMVFVMLFGCLSAQSNIRLNNYWGNMQSMTPAAVYDKYLAVFNIAAKKQWFGIQGAPATLFASGTTYLEDLRTQLGLSVIQDKVGYTYQTNVNLSYAYVLNLNYTWQLHLGIAGNFQAISYDLGQVTTADEAVDPVLIEKLRKANDFDADLGLEFSSQSLKIGLASQNVMDAFDSSGKLQQNTNLLYARFREYSESVFNYGAGVAAIQYADIYQLEFNVSGYFKNKWSSGLTNIPDLFDIGVFYRTGSQAGIILGLSLGDDFHISYSYDYHFGSLSRGSYGTNEIMLTFNLRRQPICHNCWW
jgi:type IX secretion system PorP/SprF family membrane protein